MKKVSLVLAAVLCLVGLVGCSDGGNFEVAVHEAAPGNRGFFDSVDGGYDDYDYYDYEDSTGWSLDSNTASGGAGRDEVAGATVNVTERKVIRNAYLTVEAQHDVNLSRLYKELASFCNYLGGYEFSSEVNNSELHSRVEAVLKVPPQKLDEFIAFVGKNATIIHLQTDSDDVTSEYYDLATRIETKRRSLESYYKLLENAESLNDILSLQRTIDTLTEEIEAVEGRLRVLSELVGMATVRVSIYQSEDPALFEEEPYVVDWSALSIKDMGHLIGNGFKTVVNVIVTIVQWVIIFVVVTSPLWFPVLIIGFIIIKRQKKQKAKRLLEIAEKEKEYKASIAKETESNE